MATKRNKRKLLRRVRERMNKTGESYGTALRNLRTIPTESSQAASEPSEKRTGPKFSIHTALAALATPPLDADSPDVLVAREKRVWAQLEREAKRIGGPRQVEEVLKAVRAKRLTLPQLEQLARSLATLPTNFFKILIAEAERMRLMMAEAEQIHRMMGMIPDSFQQDREIAAMAQQVIAGLEVTRELQAVIPEISTSHRAFDHDLREMTRAINEINGMTQALNEMSQINREVNSVGQMYQEIRKAGELYRPLRDVLEVAKPLVSAGESVASRVPRSVASSISRNAASSLPESVLDRTLDRRLREAVSSVQSRIDAAATRQRQLKQSIGYVPRSGW